MNWWEEPKIKCTATDATRNLQLKWKQSRVSVRARWSEKNIIIYQSICKINVKRLCSCCPSNVLHTHHDRAVACLRCFPLSLCLSHFIFSATTKRDFSKKNLWSYTSFWNFYYCYVSLVFMLNETYQKIRAEIRINHTSIWDVIK